MWQIGVVVLAVMSSLQLAQARNPSVNTTSGQVEGFVKTVTVGNRKVDVNVFLGIPYAEAPIGLRRFGVTVAKDTPENFIDGTDYGPVCPQDMIWLNTLKPRYPPSAFVVSEDCLVLNIYAPSNISAEDRKSTMVWIHGGSYNSGAANIYDGSLLAAYGDVVVVVINYRLGVLGYLAPGHRFPNGNYGTYDQQAAVLWVVNNIRNFGGTPSNLTLFGESAGASSVSLLTFNYNANQLIRRVIIESGAALTNWAIVKDPYVKAMAVASYAKCPNTTDKLINCLRNKTVDEIIKYQTQLEIAKGSSVGLNFGPVVDGQFYLYSPEDIAAGKAPKDYTERFNEIDHLIGTNSQEGAWIFKLKMGPYMKKFHFNDSVVGLPKGVYREMVNQSAHDFSTQHAEQLLPLLEYRYTDHDNPDDGMQRAITFTEALSDSTFYAGIVGTAQLHASAKNNSENEAAGNTFFYLFDHRGSWMSHEPWRTGADHGDEVPFVFGLPLISPLSSGEEKELSVTMMKLWSNYAKTGNPNQPLDPEYPTTWPEYKLGEEKYMVLSLEKNPDLLIRRKLEADRVDFWKDLMPKFLASFKPAEPCPAAKTIEIQKPCSRGATLGISHTKLLTVVLSVVLLCVVE